ncbi:uncharacterized protein LOC141690397 [Apium graveolens]|uniref:uncharacterized protein LOC141690397 n=1 Tax=Apium graveolens TaxID=4045 RepID=UPI003D7AD31D
MARNCYVAALNADETGGRVLHIKDMNVYKNEKHRGKAAEDLVPIPLDSFNSDKVTYIEASFEKPLKGRLTKFFQENGDMFSWTLSYMPGIDPNLLTHKLNVDLTQKAVKYEIPRILVIDNGAQFNNKEFKRHCEENEIELQFTSVAHPQANGQAKMANRILRDWTTCRVTAGATPFMLAYGEEAFIPVEISHSSPRIQAYNLEENNECQRLALDLIDEVREEENARIVEYKKKASFYYNIRVKERFFKQGDLVLKRWKRLE